MQLIGSLELVHLSDLHFHDFPRGLREWSVKRALVSVNMALRWRRKFPFDRHRRLVQIVSQMAWDHLVISGDLTQLGLAREFERASEALMPLLSRGSERITIVPGNHDHFATESQPSAFYRKFADFAPDQATGIGTKHLGGCWYLVAWDSAVPRRPFDASGFVPRAVMQATSQWLESLPSGARVVLVNHYPVLFPESHAVRTSHELRNLEDVQRWIANAPIDVYLHGHVHRQWILRTRGRTRDLLSVNSASSTQLSRSPGAASFHLLRLPIEGPPQVEAISLDQYSS